MVGVLKIEKVVKSRQSVHLTALSENILSTSPIFQGQRKFGTDRSLASQILFLLVGVKVIDLLVSLLVETVESG